MIGTHKKHAALSADGTTKTCGRGHTRDAALTRCAECWRGKKRERYALNNLEFNVAKRIWRESNPEKVKEYRKKHQANLTVEQKARNAQKTAKLRERDPEKFRARHRCHMRKQRAEVSLLYVAKLLGGRVKDFPLELVEAKSLHIKILRLIKEK